MEIKSKFKNWLSEQGINSKTISNYLYRIQKVLNKNWDTSPAILTSVLVKYYELSNRQYYLDRITVWQALKYFDRILDDISPNSSLPSDEVKIFLYDGKDDYFVCNSNLKFLYDDILFINHYLYESIDQLQNKHQSYIDPVKFSMLMLQIKEKSQVDELKNLAIHIAYNMHDVSNTKAALTKYSNFLYETHNSLTYNLDETIFYIQNENPNNQIGNQYNIKQEITGKNPLQLEIKKKGQYYYGYEPEYILIKSDLANILKVDRKSINKHFSRNKIKWKFVDQDGNIQNDKIKNDKTVLRVYYSIISTNEFLNFHHHSIKNKHTSVNYDCEGYDYWINRREATDLLDISHNAFPELVVSENCSYINYISGYNRYYRPDLEYLKTTEKIKKFQAKKNTYKTNKTSTLPQAL